MESGDGCGGGTGRFDGADGGVDKEVDEMESERDGEAEGGGGGGRATTGLYGSVSETSVSVVEADPSERIFRSCSSVRKFSCTSNSLLTAGCNVGVGALGSGCNADVEALAGDCDADIEVEDCGLMTSMSWYKGVRAALMLAKNRSWMPFRTHNVDLYGVHG